MSGLIERYGPAWLLLAASASMFGAVVLYLAWKSGRRRNVVAVVIALAVGGWILSAVAPATTRTRGGGEGATLLVSYIAMVLGMMAHYVYTQVEKGQTSLTIEWLPFFMPVLASPIVFIPLVTIAGQVPSTGGIFTRAHVMVYLVAFQNGFFWKHFFDRRRPEAAPASDA